jgi:7,8-dihydropterin-6-yl-methyl-4-(beta-D-ribofuranosyl)aminobenzene 5'-phosphate synthase
MSVTLTVVAENRVGLSQGLIAEHGFCVHLDLGESALLWDTGQGMALASNAPRLGLDWKKIQTIALSHGHFDHTGGLAAALELAGGCRVVCHPACFEGKIARREFFGKTLEIPVGMPAGREACAAKKARFQEVEDSLEILPGVFFFGSIPMDSGFETIEAGFFVRTPEGLVPDPFADDAALAVKTDKGVSVILGCAHRGLINTLRHIKNRLGVDRIYSVWGGTHLLEKNPEAVAATIAALREMEVGTVAAAHCTGFGNELKLAAALGDRFRFAHVGARETL